MVREVITICEFCGESRCDCETKIQAEVDRLVSRVRGRIAVARELVTRTEVVRLERKPEKKVG